MSSRYFLLPLLVVFAASVRSAGAGDVLSTPDAWPVERLNSEIPNYRIEDTTAKIQSLIYDGESIGGEATEVFAFYASPKTLGVLTINTMCSTAMKRHTQR